MEGVGLSITAGSYAGSLYLAALSADSLHEPLTVLADAITDALELITRSADLPTISIDERDGERLLANE